MTRKRLIIISLIFLLLFMIVEAAGLYIGRNKAGDDKSEHEFNKRVAGKSLERLKTTNRVLKKRLRNLSPKGIYIVIDTAKNVLYLKQNGGVMREAVVSCGSGNILDDPRGKSKWVFDTPRGEFMVRAKKVKPAWTKPDWAFVEEGEDIPEDIGDRIENGVLGDYALGFGNGYFIHGTLYTRLLGRNVTHGCIRAGDEDLKAIYMAAPVGTKIFIF
jgi:L,D-transpeptidase YbiS